MRPNPLTKLLRNRFKKDPLRQAADDFLSSVIDARRMENAGTYSPLPTHLSEGMYQGVAIRDVPTWFLESLTKKGPMEYALGEAVCGELIRRQTGAETLTLEDTLHYAQDMTKNALDMTKKGGCNARRD